MAPRAADSEHLAARLDAGRAAAVAASSDSAPSGRDYAAERAALLARADEIRAEFDSAANDMGAMAAETLRRCGCAADVAMQQGTYAAEDARAKIAQQQDRFKAGVVADGLSLDDEVELEPRAAAAAAPPVANKYSMLMNQRKTQQQAERLS